MKRLVDLGGNTYKYYQNVYRSIMKVFGEIDLKGITKIVINQISVFERKDNPVVWIKTAGGKDYCTDYPLILMPHQMMRIVNKILTRPQRKTTPCGDVIITGTAYRAWPAGETLNIVRKDAVKKK